MLQTRSVPSRFWWDSSISDLCAVAPTAPPSPGCDPQETFPDTLLEPGLPKKKSCHKPRTSSVSALRLCRVNFLATLAHFSSAGCTESPQPHPSVTWACKGSWHIPRFPGGRECSPNSPCSVAQCHLVSCAPAGARAANTHGRRSAAGSGENLPPSTAALMQFRSVKAIWERQGGGRAGAGTVVGVVWLWNERERFVS